MSDKEQSKKTVEDFASAYNKLCEEYGFQIQAVPQWVMRDDGSWSMIVRVEVVETPKK